MKKSPFLFLLLALIMVSCSVKKRSFRKGYYIDWVISKKAKTNNADIAPELVNYKKDRLSSNVSESPSSEIFASADKSQILISEIKTNVLPEDSCNDMIYYHNGSEIQAKVIEIADYEVKYKKCGNLDGPVYTIQTKDVLMIKYANGSVKNFIDPFAVMATQERKVPGVAKVALICAIGALLSFLLSSLVPAYLLTGIGALIFGIIAGNKARKKIKTDPTKYKGLGIANAALIICYGIIAIIVVGIIAAILLA